MRGVTVQNPAGEHEGVEEVGVLLCVSHDERRGAPNGLTKFVCGHGLISEVDLTRGGVTRQTAVGAEGDLAQVDRAEDRSWRR